MKLIAIKDMVMPSNCKECKITCSQLETEHDKISSITDMAIYDENLETKRLSNCPLVEVTL